MEDFIENQVFGQWYPGPESFEWSKGGFGPPFRYVLKIDETHLKGTGEFWFSGSFPSAIHEGPCAFHISGLPDGVQAQFDPFIGFDSERWNARFDKLLRILRGEDPVAWIKRQAEAVRGRMKGFMSDTSLRPLGSDDNVDVVLQFGLQEVVSATGEVELVYPLGMLYGEEKTRPHSVHIAPVGKDGAVDIRKSICMAKAPDLKQQFEDEFARKFRASVDAYASDSTN